MAHDFEFWGARVWDVGQRMERGRRARTAFASQQRKREESAVCIQASFRASVHRRNFKQQREAAVHIQARVRGANARNFASAKHQRESAAALAIQVGVPQRSPV